MEDLNYERDVFIDESALDVECLNQAPLMVRYSKQLAKANKEVSRLKEKVKVEQAKLSKDIRTNPRKYDLLDIKITEDVVKGTITTHKVMQELNEELIEAEYEVDMVKGAVDAVKQRKDMLQELVKLHGQQYFAGPSMPRDLSHEVKQKITKSQSNDTIKITRRK